MHSDLAVVHVSVFPKLCPQAPENGDTQLFFEDGGPLCPLPQAVDVAASTWSRAETLASEAASLQLGKQLWGIGHEARWLLDRVAFFRLLA